MMGSDTETTVGRVFLAVIGAICLAAAFGPSLQMLRDSVWKTTFARLTITSGGSLLTPTDAPPCAAGSRFSVQRSRGAWPRVGGKEASSSFL